MKAPILALLPCALASPLQQKQAQLASLQNQLHSQLARYQNVLNVLSKNNATPPSVESSVDKQIYQDMDATTLNLTTLIGRTKKLMSRVGEYNKQALQEYQFIERLSSVLADEIGRRDRFIEWKATHLSAEGENSTNVTVSQDYMSLADLQALFDHEKIINPTEKKLVRKIIGYTKQSLNEIKANESTAVQGIYDENEQKYSAQFEAIISTSKKLMTAGACITIPQSLELVENELHNYYLGINMVDFASYENGGNVVYALTSNAYRPPPRNDVAQNSGDKAVEQMYFDQKAYLEDGNNQMVKDTKLWMEQNDQKEWYANYKLGKLRPYLPQDWERTIDWFYNRFSSESWDEFTPRGAMDALVPDYVHQSLGFGEFGQTAGPEVAISSGETNSNESKQIGQCFPLSMRPIDDPALAYLSRLDGFDIDESHASIMAGPKYTVRLSQPIYIDAVTLEHRSFPISKVALGVGLKGGESAPRHVRVVGFAPCADEKDEDCTARGFDITDTIDLGSFEYHRVTVSGKEGDYGGYDDADEGTKKRYRRSTQTFAVKGGNWKPRAEMEHESEDSAFSSAGEEQCSFDDLECKAKQDSLEGSEHESDPLAAALAAQGGGGGECKPNYEDMTAVPDCGADDTQSVSSNEDKRSIVAAVSFIIEKNWGNPEYTCLYRVQVHGDAIPA